jgi:hypothetical protein
VYLVVFAGDRICTEVWDKAMGAYRSGAFFFKKIVAKKKRTRRL